MIQKKTAALILIVTSIVFFSLGWYLNSITINSNKKFYAVAKSEIGTDSMDSIMEINYPEYQVYGMHDEKDKQRQLIDHLYKFRFTIIGGCIVDEMIKVRADMKNAKTNTIMTIRYGKGWMDKFEASVDSLYKLDSLAINILKESKYVNKNLPTTDKHNSHIEPKYDSYETSVDNIRMVTLTGEQPLKGRMKYMNQLRAAVDVEKRKVVDIDTLSYGD